MSSTLRVESNSCLQTANTSEISDQSSITVPRARAWRIGGGLIVVRCPLCGGRHIHGQPETADETSRVPHCSPAFLDETQAPREYVLDVKRGPPPDQISDSLRRDLPLGDLGIAYEMLSDGERISQTKFDARDEDGPENFWIPGVAQLRFAFRALSQCGGLDEAIALRAELAGLTGRGLLRAAASDIWRRQPGRTWRAKLLRALQTCWRQHGGPV